jgi:hypothetical protein
LEIVDAAIGGDCDPEMQPLERLSHLERVARRVVERSRIFVFGIAHYQGDSVLVGHLSLLSPLSLIRLLDSSGCITYVDGQPAGSHLGGMPCAS